MGVALHVALLLSAAPASTWSLGERSPLLDEPFPSAKELLSVAPGTPATLLGHKTSFVQVRLPDGAVGWVERTRFREMSRLVTTVPTSLHRSLEKDLLRRAMTPSQPGPVMPAGTPVERLAVLDENRIYQVKRADGSRGYISAYVVKPAVEMPVPKYRSPRERWYRDDRLRERVLGAARAELEALLGAPIAALPPGPKGEGEALFFRHVVGVRGAERLRGVRVALAGGRAVGLEYLSKGSSAWVEALPFASEVRGWDAEPVLAALVGEPAADEPERPWPVRLGLGLLGLVLLLLVLLVPLVVAALAGIAWGWVKPLPNLPVLALAAATVVSVVYLAFLVIVLHWVHTQPWIFAALLLPGSVGAAWVALAVLRGHRCPHCHAMTNIVAVRADELGRRHRTEKRTRQVKVGEKTTRTYDEYNDGSRVLRDVKREDVYETEGYEAAVTDRHLETEWMCERCERRWVARETRTSEGHS